MEAAPSAAADLETSLSVGTNVKRHDRLVQYLWAAKGYLEEDPEAPACSCGPRYVRAVLERSK